MRESGVIMIIQNVILPIFVFMLVLNLFLFFLLLARKMYMIRAARKKEILRAQYEQELMDYMSHQQKDRVTVPAGKWERKVFEELILSYGSFLTGDAKESLLEVIGKEEKIAEITKQLKRENPWEKRIATYQAGEFGLKEVSPLLLEQLETEDRELLYITARALIKMEGRRYVRDIFEAVGKEGAMEKNNILVLVELVEEDIRDLLEEIMRGSNPFLQALALEIYGKRQYMEGVPWMQKMVSRPQKEIRIGALKGAAALGDIGDEDYFHRMAALETDEHWEVRAFLGKYLKHVKNDQAIEILKRLVKDPNWYVRTNAADALDEQGEKGLKTLVELLDSKDRFAVDKAREVIQRKVIFYGLLDRLKEGPVKNRIIQEMEKELMEGRESIE